MEKFNIENLERKNRGQVPEHFFERMQENVLDRTVRAEAKTVPLQPRARRKVSWGYAIAAALAIIFGSIFIFNQTESNKELPTKAIAENVDFNENTITANENTKPDADIIEPNENIAAIANTDEIASVDKEVKTEINSTSKMMAKNEKTTKVTAKSKVQTQENVDFILESFTADEIATLAKNTENDIYLDLYN